MSSVAEIPVADEPAVQVFVGDIDAEAYTRALEALVIAWDVETTGLDWRADRLATVQIQAGDHVSLVRVGNEAPQRLKRLLERQDVVKVMHHAMFDLRFMANEWGVVPRGVVCTKIASKLVHRGADNATHSLAALVKRYFDVELDKGERLSDWTARLSDAQVRYAADDVRYLIALYQHLERELDERDLLALRDRCYEHLGTRVALELGGFGDVYSY